ncbi:ferrochelatase [Aureococcus anophagefferens virus]|uniref:Putative oxogluterate/iron-dependent dioxygenase n=1 Tax=Aureococcus anophagefferens virus TaxID=1474867 RepID=A0A076FHA1_9VIRU|nr:ferrochelatase [Aureococcus anophagefferens virus]AII17142.1 putative oxogluterate/iron-dependent dioxygenase [Aureococcus anophagefferens virus]UOG94217.1 hypothetical protein MKD35_176 [Aureococcus anophagefferens virus]
MEVLHENPKIQIQKDFLTTRTCNHFIKISKDKLKAALVSSDKGGVTTQGRSGRNCWIKHDFDATTLRVAKAISKIVGLPLCNAEAFQIIYYDKDQEYRNHHDSWEHDLSAKSLRCLKFGGQRMKTALCYLNTPVSGGSTRFTRLDIDVPAEKGKLLVFSNVHEGTNKKHLLSEHCGCPVISGEKYAFNLWFREGDFKKIIYDPEIPKIKEEEEIKDVKDISVIPNILTDDDVALLKSKYTKDIAEKNSQWLDNNEHKDIIEKIMKATYINTMDKFETLNIVNYPSNFTHNCHYDAFKTDRLTKERRGQRLITISLILDEVHYNFTKLNKKYELKPKSILIYNNVNGDSNVRNENMIKMIENKNTTNAMIVHLYIRERNRNCAMPPPAPVVEEKPEEIEDYSNTLNEVYHMISSNKLSPRGHKSMDFLLKEDFNQVKSIGMNLMKSNGCLNPDTLARNDFKFDEKTPIHIDRVFKNDVSNMITAFYKSNIENGVYSLGDRQSNRYKTRNDPVSRMLHYEMLPLVEKFVGKPLKPTYTYLSSYIKDADLPFHTDNRECEFTVSYLINRPELSKWPIYLDKNKQKRPYIGRLDYTPDKNSCFELDFNDNNSLLCFCGQSYGHYREKLNFEYYNVLLFHYKVV